MEGRSNSPSFFFGTPPHAVHVPGRDWTSGDLTQVLAWAFYGPNGANWKLLRAEAARHLFEPDEAIVDQILDKARDLLLAWHKFFDPADGSFALWFLRSCFHYAKFEGMRLVKQKVKRRQSLRLHWHESYHLKSQAEERESADSRLGVMQRVLLLIFCEGRRVIESLVQGTSITQLAEIQKMGNVAMRQRLSRARADTFARAEDYEHWQKSPPAMLSRGKAELRGLAATSSMHRGYCHLYDRVMFSDDEIHEMSGDGELAQAIEFTPSSLRTKVCLQMRRLLTQ